MTLKISNTPLKSSKRKNEFHFEIDWEHGDADGHSSTETATSSHEEAELLMRFLNLLCTYTPPGKWCLTKPDEYPDEMLVLAQQLGKLNDYEFDIYYPEGTKCPWDEKRELRGVTDELCEFLGDFILEYDHRWEGSYAHCSGYSVTYYNEHGVPFGVSLE